MIGNPTATMSTPAIGGPPTIPRLLFSDESAAAAGSSSVETSLGTIASSEGRCRPSTPDHAKATTKSTHSCGCAESEFATSTPITRHIAPSVSRTIRRRSTASARAPPTNAVTSSGMSSARLRSPTMRDEWLSRYAWYGSVT